MSAPLPVPPQDFERFVLEASKAIVSVIAKRGTVSASKLRLTAPSDNPLDPYTLVLHDAIMASLLKVGLLHQIGDMLFVVTDDGNKTINPKDLLQ